MLQQGVQLLERFTQDGRVQIRQPHSHQQIRFSRELASGQPSSPLSMRLANWTAYPVCWSGRPARLAIRRSLPEWRPWIRS